jgi:hypothetical protein
MSHSIHRSLVAATTLSAVLALGASAAAGTLQVRDDADILTPAQETQLRASGAQYPFDVRVLTDARFTRRDDFDRHVAAQVVRGDMVVVGVDPVHRWSSVHVGTSTRIATARFAAITNAGDAYFRGSRWEEGFGAILGVAQQSVGSAVPGDAAPAAPRASFPWRMVIFGLLAVGGIALAVRAFRSPQRPMDGAGWNRPPAQGYGQPPYGAPPMGPSPLGYGPAPGSGIGTGIAGAALGGLAGYALGNAMAHRGDDAPHASAGAEGTPDTWDGGGSTSGWEDGGGGGDAGGDAGGGGDW